MLIVMGLYSVLWGKYKEYQEIEAELMALPEVSSTNKIEMQKDGEPNTDSAVAVGVLVQQSSSIGASRP